ncbi:hypothetical protein [Caballeronia sp. LjRoot31]|uniref:hypothetical protein n=1 Tax=Caballeronia sp. LjRoot31 TaxID=3342324 RepID=UPI003ECF8925
MIKTTHESLVAALVLVDSVKAQILYKLRRHAIDYLSMVVTDLAVLSSNKLLVRCALFVVFKRRGVHRPKLVAQRELATVDGTLRVEKVRAVDPAAGDCGDVITPVSRLVKYNSFQVDLSHLYLQ